MNSIYSRSSESHSAEDQLVSRLTTAVDLEVVSVPRRPPAIVSNIYVNCQGGAV